MHFFLGVDGTPSSISAFYCIAGLFVPSRGDYLTIIHVTDPTVEYQYDMKPRTIEEFFSTRCASRFPPHSWEIKIVKRKSDTPTKRALVQAVNDASKNSSEELLVIGHAGKKAPGEAATVLGSTSDYSLREAAMPSLIVKGGVERGGGGMLARGSSDLAMNPTASSKSLRNGAEEAVRVPKFVVAVDGSERAHEGLNFVMRLRNPGDDVKVLHIESRSALGGGGSGGGGTILLPSTSAPASGREAAAYDDGESSAVYAPTPSSSSSSVRGHYLTMPSGAPLPLAQPGAKRGASLRQLLESGPIVAKPPAITALLLQPGGSGSATYSTAAPTTPHSPPPVNVVIPHVPMGVGNVATTTTAAPLSGAGESSHSHPPLVKRDSRRFECSVVEERYRDYCAAQNNLPPAAASGKGAAGASASANTESSGRLLPAQQAKGTTTTTTTILPGIATLSLSSTAPSPIKIEQQQLSSDPVPYRGQLSLIVKTADRESIQSTVAAAIVDAADEVGANILVVGVDGIGSRALGQKPRLGSVSDAIVKKARCSVLCFQAKGALF